MMKGLDSPILAVLLCLMLFSCGQQEPSGQATASSEETGGKGLAQTPQEAYARLVNSVKSGDYGAMYDLMDSANKHYTDMWFDLNLRQVNLMDSAQKAGWEQFRSITDPRKRFQRLVEVTPMMRERFTGGYKLVEADTIVAVVTQHSGQQPQITYFRWEDGGYKYTAPPESKTAPAAVKTQVPQSPEQE